MTYRLLGIVLSALIFCLSANVYSASTTQRATSVSAGTSSTGYVGEQEVEITRLKAGRVLYPKSAQRRNIEGAVTIEFNIGIDGTVSSAYIVEANPPGRFDSSALRYVNTFVYEPYRQNGTPVEVERITVTIPFRLR